MLLLSPPHGKYKRQRGTRDDNRVDVQKWTFLSEFLDFCNHSFYERHITVTIHNIHVPEGVERTFLLLILEEKCAWREMSHGADVPILSNPRKSYAFDKSTRISV